MPWWLAVPLALCLLPLGPLLARADTSLGDWNPGAGSYTINTTTLTLTGPGTSYVGQDDSGIATFTFGEVDIPTGATVTVSGTLPLELVATTSFTLAGTISGDGDSAGNFSETPGGSPGGPGGGNGGEGGYDSGAVPAGAPATSGGGYPGLNSFSGAGGGAFGGIGAAGGYDLTGATGLGGQPTYGDLLTELEGGSGGGGGPEGGDGGGGGGAIEVQSLTGSLSIAATGQLTADGGNGACGGTGESGGGSGGGILLEAHSYSNDGLVTADGGQGRGGYYGGGGGGGGGRIVVLYNTLSSTGTTSAAGGLSYVAAGCGTPAGTQPDPVGGTGQTLFESPTTTTSFTTSPTSPNSGSQATLAATVLAAVGPLPSGTVSFSDAAGTLCTATLSPGSSSSNGSCTYRAGEEGADQITASYDPSGPDASSTDAATVSNQAALPVAVPTTGAAPGELTELLGIAALLAGVMVLSLVTAWRPRRTS
ncbi:MAG: Ig-like domain repeat protein [Candidatus Dormiibacterota bacterium]